MPGHRERRGPIAVGRRWVRATAVAMTAAGTNDHRFGKTKPKSCVRFEVPSLVDSWQNETKKAVMFQCPGTLDILAAYPLHGSAFGSYRSPMTWFHGTARHDTGLPDTGSMT